MCPNPAFPVISLSTSVIHPRYLNSSQVANTRTRQWELGYKHILEDRSLVPDCVFPVLLNSKWLFLGLERELSGWEHLLVLHRAWLQVPALRLDTSQVLLAHVLWDPLPSAALGHTALLQPTQSLKIIKKTSLKCFFFHEIMELPVDRKPDVKIWQN